MKLTASDLARSGPWFFAFKISEYAYREIKFSKHRTLEAAERRAHVRFSPHANQSVYADKTPMVFHGVLTLEEWAKECDYEIDWKAQVLTWRGKAP